MALDIFARIGTIKGESRDAKHKDEIDVISWSWGLSQTATGGPVGGAAGGLGRSRGKPSVGTLTFTHYVDRSSTFLMKACATGEHLSDATITVRKAGAGQQEYLVVTMADVLVMSVSTSVSADSAATSEVVELVFGRVDVEYRPQKADGTLEAGVHFAYDVTAQR